ncbi:poly(ADP-ribose) glycohydrolase domain-containing protein [Enhygromyxa salina]|uniref:poly(ADP-ribose) glycohydrolase domain-containing protein n=1 Tax=Enhygromyxa salina TaxID=215803 RepID=UPI0015E7D918|nr:poly(ADP-ribose) glycohydrolase domain-containing protein [Enhygromyxa salina]
MGRTIPSEQVFGFGVHASPAFVRRREVLRETVAALLEAEPPDQFHRLAQANLARWRAAASPASGPIVEVIPGDWGEVTHALTKAHGHTFAVLNMANAYVPGGGYVEGSPAQEENMFRRTDCHLAVVAADMDPVTERYRPRMTALLNAEHGRVLLDTQRPRVCLRAGEDRERGDLGYAWLPEDEVFPFFELRAAAMDLRDGRRFDPELASEKIRAQLDTLIEAGVRHAVLSAFGCGAFANPADQVARLYAEALRARPDAFDRVAFAIFHPGYGPDNFTPFERVFAGG